MSSQDVYFRQERREMLGFIPRETTTLIDVGCGEGLFCARVKEILPSCEVWGLEPVDAVAALAAPRCDKLINAPFDDATLLPSAYFDVVTMNDVLEHIPSTESALGIVKQILKPGGTLIVSLPNVAFYLNVKDLIISNDWEYKDYGILDRTHMRFFTERSASRTIAGNGFNIVTVRGINESAPKIHYRALLAVLGKFGRPMRFPQFAVVAKLAQP